MLPQEGLTSVSFGLEESIILEMVKKNINANQQDMFHRMSLTQKQHTSQISINSLELLDQTEEDSGHQHHFSCNQS